MLTSDDAVQWIHETVGDGLDGEAPLLECIDFIRRRYRNDPVLLHELNMHALPLIAADEHYAPAMARDRRQAPDSQASPE